MPSTDGSAPSLAKSLEMQAMADAIYPKTDETFHVKQEGPPLRERVREIVERQRGVLNRLDEGPREGLTKAERDAIAGGEPYCFRCGKPASSFSEYCNGDCDGDDECRSGPPYPGAADYVREEEGTYNRETNRFACDECYIAIGMPSEPGGWRAP